jgi:hypothetical protein
MTFDPAAVDRTSLKALQRAFRDAPDPELADLVGDLAAELVGPAWMRAAGPTTMRAGRMAGWCGKRFEPDEDGDGILHGFNRVQARRGRGAGSAGGSGSTGPRQDSVPIVARLGASRVDGRPALLVTYPPDAPFPWPRVTDEFRRFGDGTLLGLSFGIPLAPSGGTPFLLHRMG